MANALIVGMSLTSADGLLASAWNTEVSENSWPCMSTTCEVVIDNCRCGR